MDLAELAACARFSLPHGWSARARAGTGRAAPHPDRAEGAPAPPEEKLVAQKLMSEAGEERFFRTANRTILACGVTSGRAGISAKLEQCGTERSAERRLRYRTISKTGNSSSEPGE